MKYTKILLLSFLIVAFYSCTKLDETFRSELSQNNSGNVTAAELLLNAYNSLGTFQTGNIWHLEQHSSDETLGPTRGPDWDDNGQWRALHAHTWNADHGTINGAFSDLLSAQFAASNVLQFSPSAQQAAEARFIRALTVFFTLDGWGQVPYREDLNDYRLDPLTLKGAEAADFVISELKAILNDLPDSGPAYTANKNAAKFLLMKTYLNYGAFADRANPSFPADKMSEVIALADEITGSGKYEVNPDSYYDNFAPDNDAKSTENIYTIYNQNGDRGGNVQGTWFQISHYNMDPGGWNGFATLSDFYDKFEATDERIGKAYTYPGARPNPGNRRNVGFLIGQQYNLTTDAALQDRKGNALSFTREVNLRETGNNLEITGIRVVKYAYDYAHYNSQNNNDWAFFRYADVLLMKAEALLRTGDASEALDIVNSIREKRGASDLTSLNESSLLDERGRELYWEGWRRQDLIRFGKYLDLWQEKTADDPKNLLFPIPSNQLAVNANLEQNPGY